MWLKKVFCSNSLDIPWASCFGTCSSARKKTNMSLKIHQDMLLEIFAFCEPQELTQLSLVCKQWRHIANDERLWKQLFAKKYRLLERNGVDKKNWKETYIAAVFWDDFLAKLSAQSNAENRKKLWQSYSKLLPYQKETMSVSFVKALYGSLYCSNSRLKLAWPVYDPEFIQTFCREIKAVISRIKALTGLELREQISVNNQIAYYHLSAKMEELKTEEEKKVDLLKQCVLAYENKRKEGLKP